MTWDQLLEELNPDEEAVAPAVSTFNPMRQKQMELLEAVCCRMGITAMNLASVPMHRVVRHIVAMGRGKKMDVEKLKKAVEEFAGES